MNSSLRKKGDKMKKVWDDENDDRGGWDERFFLEGDGTRWGKGFLCICDRLPWPNTFNLNSFVSLSSLRWPFKRELMHDKGLNTPRPKKLHIEEKTRQTDCQGFFYCPTRTQSLLLNYEKNIYIKCIRGWSGHAIIFFCEFHFILNPIDPNEKKNSFYITHTHTSLCRESERYIE